jgi:hypothetical protein
MDYKGYSIQEVGSIFKIFSSYGDWVNGELPIHEAHSLEEAKAWIDFPIGIPSTDKGPVERGVTGILAAAERISGRELPLETRALIYSESGTLVSHSVPTLEQAIRDAQVFRNAGMAVKIMFEPHPHYCAKPWEVAAHPLSFHEMVAGVELENAKDEVHIKGIGKFPMSMLADVLSDYDRESWPGFDRSTCSFRRE